MVHEAAVASSCDESRIDEHDPGAGALTFCCLTVRGVAKVVQAVVIKRRPFQSVVACPAGCALAVSGEWAERMDSGQWQVYSCTCEGLDTTCAVVFYTVDTESLCRKPVLPVISRFTDSTGHLAVPSADDLDRLYHADANEDSLLIQGVRTVPDGPVSRCYEVSLGQTRELFLFNSVVVIPDFLTRDECYVLIEAADRTARAGTTAAFYSYQAGLTRLPVRKLDLEAQMLSTEVMTNRLLSFIEQEMPQVSEELFGRSAGLAKMKFAYSPGEPAVNRYACGGGLKRHTDFQTVTLNVILSDLGAFAGGGTTFWPQDSGSAADDDNSVTLRPLQGTAILFNGDIEHAGRAVVSGVRHTYVASFNLWSLDDS